MDPRITPDRFHSTTTGRRGRRLAAAAAGAALVVTMGALPAQAETAAPDAAGTTASDTETGGMPWTEVHGNPIGSINSKDNPEFVFSTDYNFGPDDVRLVAVPSDETGQATGDEIAVDYTWREEISGGKVDAEKARQVLGDDAHGHVTLRVYAGDAMVAHVVLGPDEDLTDGHVDVVDMGRGAGMNLGDAPLERTSRIYMTPGAAGFETGWMYDPTAGDGEATMTVVSEPQHGEVVTTDAGSGNEHLAMFGLQYYPEQGYTGGDSFTVRYEAEGKVRTETYEIAWNGDVVEELFVGDLPMTGVLGAAEIPARPSDPGEPGPADPVEPADPEEPGDDQGEDSGEHTVPDKVETGGQAHLAMGATAAFGATALIGAALLGRRRAAER